MSSDLEALFDGAPDLVCILALDGTVTRGNAAWLRLLAIEPAALSGSRLGDLAHAEDRQGIARALGLARAGARAACEHRIAAADGSRRWVSWRVQRVGDALVAIGREDAALAASEDRLRRSEARFRTLIEHLPEPVSVVRDGEVVYVNPAAVRIMGAQRIEEIVGRSPLEFVHADERDEAGRRISEAGESLPSSVERRLLTVQGRELRVRVVTLPITYDGARAAMTIFHDVTERQRLEAQLHVAQRMEAVGRLAGGIAHDFNNMLSLILNYAALIRRGLPERPELQEQLSQIEHAAQRSATLTRQLLTFSRHQVFETAVLDPSEIVRRLAELLAGTLGEQVEIRTSIDEESWNVRMSSSQLEQVLMNLAVNARDAMPDGGVLRIELENAALPTGRWVRLVVRDTGVGMSREVAEHAFEPFFSTKPAGRGSGLGLAVVYGIVKRSGGSIVIETEPARGTAFHIHLPAVDAEVTTRKVPKLAERPRGGGEHVLVVEDEPAVRELVCRLLGRYGYVAIEAQTPHDALEIAEGDAEIDILLTDVVMPGMNGRQLALAVRGRRPELPVVYMSGYAGDAVAGLEHTEAFLAKPFTPEELLSMIRATLHRAARRRGMVGSGA